MRFKIENATMDGGFATPPPIGSVIRINRQTAVLVPQTSGSVVMFVTTAKLVTREQEVAITRQF